jgi:glucose-1-phosphate adenylyltransferase
MDFRSLLHEHIRSGADITLAVTPVGHAAASDFGIMLSGPDHRITRFEEKPKEPALLDELKLAPEVLESIGKGGGDDLFQASMGIYVFNREVLIDCLRGDEADFGKHVIPKAIVERHVNAYIFEGYWEDIGTIRAFYEANLDLVSPLPKFNFFDSSAPIYTRSRYLPPSKLSGCDIDNSMVSEGCILNGVRIRNSIIGLRSRIDSGVDIEDSIVMGSDIYESLSEIQGNLDRNAPHVGIGENTTIRRCIIDKNVRIGKNVKLINQGGAIDRDADDRSYYIRDGIIIIPKNAVIADGTVI